MFRADVLALALVLSFTITITTIYRCACDAEQPPPPPPPPPCKARVCGTVTESPLFVNLTTMGRAAWVHWGDSTTTATFDPSHILTPLHIVGSEVKIKSYSNNPTAYSWGDASSNPNVRMTSTGQFLEPSVVDTGVSFSVHLPNASHTYVVRVYIGLYCAQGTLTVTATTAHEDRYATNPVYTGTFNDTLGYNLIRDGVFTITVNSTSINETNSDGHSLQINWTLTGNTGFCTRVKGNLEFQSVSVSDSTDA